MVFCGNFKNKIWNLLLYFQTGVKSQQKNSAQQQVKQSPPSLSVTEGGISILNCDYDNTMLDYFQWYRKYPAKNPTFLISISSILEKNEDGRFTVLHNRSAKHLSLHISASQPGDSALYLCSACTRCSPGHVQPVLKRALGTQTQRHTDLLPVMHGRVRSCALKWVRQLTFPFSRGSSQPRNQTRVSSIAGRFFNNWANKEAQLEFQRRPIGGKSYIPWAPGFPGI